MNIKLPKDVMALIRGSVSHGLDDVSQQVPESDVIYGLMNDMRDKLGADDLAEMLYNVIGKELDTQRRALRTRAAKASQGSLFSMSEADVIEKDDAGNLYKAGTATYPLWQEQLAHSRTNRLRVDKADDRKHKQDEKLREIGMDKDPSMTFKAALKMLVKAGEEICD